MTVHNKVDQFISDSDIAHQIVHGPRGTTVHTEGGEVPSLATVIGDVSGINERMSAIEDGQASGRVVVERWETLSAIVGAPNMGATVLSHAGTHLDPVSGATVANQGEYVWTTPQNKWKWVRADGLASKADKTELEILAEGDFLRRSNFRFVQLAPESGYAWGLVDEGSRAALLVSLDGTVRIPKYEGKEFLATPLHIDTGFLWAVVDAKGRIGLGIRADGTVVGKFEIPQPAPIKGLEYLQPRNDIWCLGDSLTAGAGGQLTWAQQLAAEFPQRRISNWGVGGQTSTQIAARAGAYPALLSVSGNRVPGSGAVEITDRTISLLTNQGMQSLRGWLGGIYGTLSRNNSTDAYLFTRSEAGKTVIVTPKMPFVPDVEKRDFETMIIFLGRNNIGAVDDIKRDIARCVSLQKTAEKRYLIITPPNGGTRTAGQSTNEGTGSFALQSIKTIEDWAVQEYGDRALKVREFSFQFQDGSADDLDDVAKETVPRSLRIDGVHWTTAFHTQVFTWIHNEIARRGW